jgi:hypothetical protein
MKKYFLSTLVILLASIFLMAGGSQATLIGLNPRLPDILSNSTGSYFYNSTTDLFAAKATPLTITFDGVNIIPILPDPQFGKSYYVSFYVDSTGKFIGPGSDLKIFTSL